MFMSSQMALTPPPIGEGALYEIHFKDLRPSLDWSPNFGWTVLASQVLTFTLLFAYVVAFLCFSFPTN